MRDLELIVQSKCKSKVNGLIMQEVWLKSKWMATAKHDAIDIQLSIKEGYCNTLPNIIKS